MRIEDPAPPDGSEPLEVSVVHNIYGLESAQGRRVYVRHLIVTHPNGNPGRVEGYREDDRHYVRVFSEPLVEEGEFEFVGKPKGRRCQLQEYALDARIRLGGDEYLLITSSESGPQHMRTNFGSQTLLWRHMEGRLLGTARWQYKPDFSDIRELGEETSLSDLLEDAH